MRTTPNPLGLASGLGRAAATISLMATLVLTGGIARAQNHPAATLVPGHAYLLPAGISFRQGDYVAIEPSVLFFVGPVVRPVALVARGVLGVGGSGGGLGLAINTRPRCPSAYDCWREDDDFFMGPFVSLEARVERTYLPIGWRRATYAGPQLTLSVYVLKASMGWMFDVTDRTNNHPQLGVGFGF
ncbi:MAG TPA: hypothetical protein VH853_23275 [Polyangia bacterium]|nr:hypothetical protein [Polyangia bacterium]